LANKTILSTNKKALFKNNSLD